jgi:hypothetical protein
MKLLGLDPSEVEQFVKKSKVPTIRKGKPSEAFPIQPQKEWEEARRRVYEQAQRLAKLLLNHVELDMSGIEIPYKYKSLKLNGRSNYICTLMMVNYEINKRLGKEREKASTEEFKDILESVEDILQTLARRLRKAKSDYERQQT